ncbi:MAG TPA: hypothetical protein VKT77_21685 [Chthonomonadaceae bacterium]|nr:hypothetical protein [Chthonomonadaceae bacterium]
MKLLKNVRAAIRQFLNNLGEPGWASRHVADGGPDLPTPAPLFNSAETASSLSIALQQMGFIRPSS